jgi:hypothetical protein
MKNLPVVLIGGQKAGRVHKTMKMLTYSSAAQNEPGNNVRVHVVTKIKGNPLRVMTVHKRTQSSRHI